MKPSSENAEVQYSVVIPSYRGDSTLPVLLASLLRQSIAFHKFEVIVVNDGGGNDKLLERIVQQYPSLRITLLQLNENLGPAAARNEGIMVARGNTIFFTDDDCEVPALWMETHLAMYDAHPELSAVGGWNRPPLTEVRRNIFDTFITLRHDSLFRLYEVQRSGRNARKSLVNQFPAINTANLSVRRYVFNDVKFDPRLMCGREDVAFSEQVRERGYEMMYIPQFVLHKKRMTLRKIIRTAYHRALGEYIYATFDEASPLWYLGGRLRVKKKIHSVWRQEKLSLAAFLSLLCLNRLYSYFYTSHIMKFFYVFAYSRHRAALARWTRVQQGTRDYVERTSIV